MRIEAYITQAKEDYPSGYSDYISKYPNETPDRWAMSYEDGRVETVKGYSFEVKDILEMDKWDNDRFWTFMGFVDYNYYNNK